jgi:hypothetical protein
MQRVVVERCGEVFVLPPIAAAGLPIVDDLIAAVRWPARTSYPAPAPKS